MRLSTIAGKHQQFLILGLDQPILVAEQLGIDLSNEAGRALLDQLFQEMVTAYSPLVTGVLLSAELGFSAATMRSSTTGLLFCLERSLSELDPYSIPVLQTNWNIEHIRNNYAMAKLTVFAQSTEDELITKLELVNELHDACHYEDIDFLLELRVIDGKRLSDEEFQQQHIRLLSLFREQCELLALEYSRSAVNCLNVTAQLKRPWIMLESAGVPYQAAKEEWRNALTGGASGMVVRNLVLPTFKKGLFKLDEFRSYLKNEGRDRLVELARICEDIVGVD